MEFTDKIKRFYWSNDDEKFSISELAEVLFLCPKSLYDNKEFREFFDIKKAQRVKISKKELMQFLYKR
jgi:hypothetical protein